MEIEAQGFNRKKAKLFQHFGGKIDCNGMTQKILNKIAFYFKTFEINNFY